MRKIWISTRGIRMRAELNQTETAKAIWEALPIEGRVKIWGEEIYFEIPIRAELERGAERVSEGDLGYWPEGNCFCIFFGKTPIST